MLRRVFRFLLCMVVALNVAVATAATPEATSESPAVNVKYIHDAISAKWGVSVGYNSQLSDKLVIANMKYLMAAIDIANKKIGGSSKVYSGTSYATSYAVNKRTVDNAIKNLIKKPRTFPFTATTTSDTTSFSFKIAAAGEFWVDWGDGSDIRVITKTDTTSQTISHTYTTAGTYTIRMGGRATKYYDGNSTANISFIGNTSLASVSGSLGEIFPTMSSTSQPRFYRTFYGCTNLTSVPETLLSGVYGAPIRNMFTEMFYNCTALTEIPAKLFSTIRGAPAMGLFNGTFYGCTGLTSIPDGLFSGLSGAPAGSMFRYVFYGCSGLTGKIPSNLFGNISGAPASSMYAWAFEGCSGLTGEIPLGLFGDLSGSRATTMFYRTFYGCKGLSGKSARNPDGTYLYDVFTSTTNSYTGYMYTGTCLEDNASIPTTWGGATCTYVEPEPENYPFELTTTSSTTSYSFKISAAGTFYVNWGDGSTYEKITKADTTTQTISHTYANKGAYTVKLAGRATAYSTNTTTAAISFAEPYDETSEYYKLASISGSLGAIFPTLSDGSQPRFYATFMYCSNLSSTIPENLFDGVSGAPVENMFDGTFSGCSRLSGEIPEKLFAGISGAPAGGMFWGTFYGCRTLSGEIPAGLFAGISGAPASNMFASTFADCRGLTGLGGALFAGIKGAPASGMYSTTFAMNSFSGEIPLGLFGDLSGAPAANMFYQTLMANSGSQLVGKSARNPDGTYLYDVFPTATSSDVYGMYYGTCLYDNASIPTTWGGKACTYTGPVPSDEQDDYPFSVTTVPNTSSMDIMFNAWGDFTIDWGDGSKETISRTTTDTKEKIYSHTYASAGTYEIKFAGTPTGYPSKLTSAVSGERHSQVAVIQFRDPYNTSTSKCNIASVSGKFGSLFPTLTSALTGSDVQPGFKSTFSKCAQLTEIPSDLFDGVSGAPIDGMFQETFADSGLTDIPDGLFSGISGELTANLFAFTFAGTPIESIPAGLFAGLSGNVPPYTFWGTFYGCSNLAAIPVGLFDGVTVLEAGTMAFGSTFADCVNLSGPSAQMSDGTYLYNLDGFTDMESRGTYENCTGLSDYDDMPDILK